MNTDINKIIEHYSKFQNCIVCNKLLKTYTNHAHCEFEQGSIYHFMYHSDSERHLQIVRDNTVIQYYNDRIVVGKVNGIIAKKIFDFYIDVEDVFFKNQEHFNLFFDKLEYSLSLYLSLA